MKKGKKKTQDILQQWLHYFNTEQYLSYQVLVLLFELSF